MPSVDDVINRLLKHLAPETRDYFPRELEGWFSQVVEPLLDVVPEGTLGVVQHGKELAVLLLAGDSGASLVEIGAAQENIFVTHLGELTGGVYTETHTPNGNHLSKSFTFSNPRIPPPGVLEFQPLGESEWEKCDVLRALLRNLSTGAVRE